MSQAGLSLPLASLAPEACTSTSGGGDPVVYRMMQVTPWGRCDDAGPAAMMRAFPGEGETQERADLVSPSLVRLGSGAAGRTVKRYPHGTPPVATARQRREAEMSPVVAGQGQCLPEVVSSMYGGTLSCPG